MNKGLSVQSGVLGCLRPRMNCKSLDAAEDVNADIIQRVNSK